MATTFFSPLGLEGDNLFARTRGGFFLSEQCKAVLARLTPLLELGGIGVLVGEPGVGKSTLLEHLLEQRVDRNRYRCVRLDFTNLSSGSFLRQLVFAFEEKPRRSKSDVVHQLVELWSCVPQNILLAIDEAQHLAGETMEDLRLLLTGVAHKKAPTVILAGHPALREMLRSPLQQALAQRVTVRCRLLGWSRSEAHSYLSQRLKQMGASSHFMDVEAMDLVYDYAKGNPRLIEQTMTACLIAMVMDRHKKLDAACFQRTLVGMEA